MNIIVAMCKNRGIGINGMIPWSLKEDMRFFKNKTIGNGYNAVIMGRKTYDSIPKSLPKRKSYIISSTKTQADVRNNELELVYSDLIQANYDIVNGKYRFEDVWVIGGGQLYEWYITNNLVKDVYVTNVLEDFECDSFFPVLPSNFKKIHSGDVVTSKENKLRYNIEVYRNNFYDLKNKEVMWCDFLRELDNIGYYGII